LIFLDKVKYFSLKDLENSKPLRNLQKLLHQTVANGFNGYPDLKNRKTEE